MNLLCRLGIHRAAIVHHLHGETCYDCVRCGRKVKSKGYDETLNEAPEVVFPVQFAKQVAVLLKENVRASPIQGRRETGKTAVAGRCRAGPSPDRGVELAPVSATSIEAIPGQRRERMQS